MALAALKTWDSEILFAADLNAEFANIRNNALSLISPLTGDLAAGNNKITGLSLGGLSSPSLQFTGDANTGIYSGGPDQVSFVAGGWAALSAAVASNTTTITLTNPTSGSTGPSLNFVANASSATPGVIGFFSNDAGGTQRTVGVIRSNYFDSTVASQDSQIIFAVMNAANATNANLEASLTSLGVWTDASGAAMKDYIGDLDGVLDKLGSLQTLGVYRGKGVTRPNAEKHFSPTAEEFFSIFGLGVDPNKGVPGIAPKDVGWLAVKAVLELRRELERGRYRD